MSEDEAAVSQRAEDSESDWCGRFFHRPVSKRFSRDNPALEIAILELHPARNFDP